jgi:GDP-4-dehydro-6-deoxy-D-mannose reductase
MTELFDAGILLIMKTILVTGANGFVGLHLVKELSDNGYTVISTGREASDALEPYVTKHYVIDLTDPEAVKQIDLTEVDGIIHLAGLAAVGPSFDAPLLYTNANMGMQINLFEAALSQKVFPKVIVVSSASLYDPKAPLPVTETTNVNPNSPYAVSKLGQEQLGLYYNSRGFEVVIARPFNHIGPGQNLGFLIPDLAKQIIEFEKDNSKDVLVGNLDAKRDYTDVRDICRAYRMLLEKGGAGETYNICSGRALSGNEILALIMTTANQQVETKQDPARMRPSDTPEIYGSNQKLNKDTGWKPFIAIEQTIADVVADWRQRLDA